MERVRVLRVKGARAGDDEEEEGAAGVAERKGAPGVVVRWGGATEADRPRP